MDPLNQQLDELRTEEAARGEAQAGHVHTESLAVTVPPVTRSTAGTLVVDSRQGFPLFVKRLANIEQNTVARLNTLTSSFAQVFETAKAVGVPRTDFDPSRIDEEMVEIWEDCDRLHEEAASFCMREADNLSSRSVTDARSRLRALLSHLDAKKTWITRYQAIDAQGRAALAESLDRLSGALKAIETVHDDFDGLFSDFDAFSDTTLRQTGVSDELAATASRAL